MLAFSGLNSSMNGGNEFNDVNHNSHCYVSEVIIRKDFMTKKNGNGPPKTITIDKE